MKTKTKKTALRQDTALRLNITVKASWDLLGSSYWSTYWSVISSLQSHTRLVLCTTHSVPDVIESRPQSAGWSHCVIPLPAILVSINLSVGLCNVVTAVIAVFFVSVFALSLVSSDACVVGFERSLILCGLIDAYQCSTRRRALCGRLAAARSRNTVD